MLEGALWLLEGGICGDGAIINLARHHFYRGLGEPCEVSPIHIGIE